MLDLSCQISWVIVCWSLIIVNAEFQVEGGLALRTAARRVVIRSQALGVPLHANIWRGLWELTRKRWPSRGANCDANPLSYRARAVPRPLVLPGVLWSRKVSAITPEINSRRRSSPKGRASLVENGLQHSILFTIHIRRCALYQSVCFSILHLVLEDIDVNKHPLPLRGIPR